MTLNDFLIWLKGKTDIPMELGMLNVNENNFLALYPLPAKEIKAIGTASSYNVKGVMLRLRYGTNFTQAENKAKELARVLENVNNEYMGSTFVYFISNITQPTYNGKDRKGVFEFTLKAEIYYERKN
jgi:hypothetical protein